MPRRGVADQREGRAHGRDTSERGEVVAGKLEGKVAFITRSYANNLAPHRIRVNSVHPTGVNTPMVVNEAMQEFLANDPSLGNSMANALPVDMVEPVDISNAIVWLVSDDARYVTGVTLPVDAGFTNKK